MLILMLKPTNTSQSICMFWPNCTFANSRMSSVISFKCGMHSVPKHCIARSIRFFTHCLPKNWKRSFYRRPKILSSRLDTSFFQTFGLFA